jgi:hypothetical protein
LPHFPWSRRTESSPCCVPSALLGSVGSSPALQALIFNWKYPVISTHTDTAQLCEHSLSPFSVQDPPGPEVQVGALPPLGGWLAFPQAR